MYKLPQLLFEYNSLEPFIDEETMRIHHTKHHQGYVDKLNATLEDYKELQSKSIEELLKSVDQIPETIRQAVINNGGGHANHSMFWEIMAPPEAKKTPSGEFLAALESTFGSFDQFKQDFNQKALSLFGSGWVFLEMASKGLNIKRHSFQNNPLMYGNLSILGLDVWEHAYYLKYQNRRVEYIEAWWNVINWKKVEENFNEASR